MNKKIFLFIFVSIVLALTAQAQIESVQYPVAELGGCANENECRAYCDKPDNIEKCISFAEKHNLLGKDELKKGKKFAEIIKSGGGPGGCKNEKSCEDYCGDVSKIRECIEFAEKNGMMDANELEEAKKIDRALQSGGKLPGGCKNRQACESYCRSKEHIEECFSFAKQHGLISEEEIKEAEKMIPLIKNGATPGQCRTKEECEAYCNEDENLDECIDFASKNGLVTEQELEIMKKTGGRGPGGCRARACETFCQKPENREACINFAKENGLLSEEQMQTMREETGHVRKALENAPPEVRECVENNAPGLLEGDSYGDGFEVSIGERIRECFQRQRPPENSMPCSNREECDAYCRANPNECKPHDGNGETEMPPTQTQAPEQYQQQFQQQYEQQYNEEYQRQYEEQYRMQMEQMQNQPMPPAPPSSFDLRQSPIATVIIPFLKQLFGR